MQKTIIAVSLAVIVGIAYEFSKVEGTVATDATATVTAPGAALPGGQAPMPVASASNAADDEIIWLDTVVVVAPRLVDEIPEDKPEDTTDNAPEWSDASAGIDDPRYRSVPVNVTPDRDRVTSDEVARARGKMSPRLRELAAIGSYEPVDIIVSLRSRPDQFESEVLANVGGVVMRRYESLNMRAIRVSAAALDVIAKEYSVKSMTLDSQVTATPVAANHT